MLFAVGLGLPFFSGLMSEAQAGNVGVIRFVGSIVEDACDVGIDKNRIKPAVTTVAEPQRSVIQLAK